eukprot:1236740-Amphidinium_carterae.1
MVEIVKILCYTEFRLCCVQLCKFGGVDSRTEHHHTQGIANKVTTLAASLQLAVTYMQLKPAAVDAEAFEEESQTI